LKNLAKLSGVDWLESPPETKRLTTSLTLRLHEVTGTPSIASLVLRSVADNVTFEIDPSWNCLWNGVHADKLEFGFDHFIPYVKFPNESGPRARQRVWHNAFNVVFGHPLEALHQLLGAMQYLSSTRQLPPSLYRPATTAPDELGVSGELAAQWLHRQQKDVVHFLPPPRIEDDKLVREDRVLERPLVQAVNTLFEALSVRVNVRVEEVQEVGFRLMFGDSSLVHVGRGIGYLLPLVELGLFADPLRFESTGDMPLTQYTQLCQSFTHIALEEPEAHLHPKVASRLAHWLVSLAMSNRRLIVETHSDHLVRRLRGLVARAGQGSELEKWLLENVVVLSVEQDAEGRSSVTSSRLTADGSVGEVWPADFMDEATDEESAIYYAKLDKAETREAPRVELIDGEEPELNEAP
jgi:predicted ATPase